MTLESNVAGVNSAAEVALSMDAVLIMASTSDVYGNAPLPFREDGPLMLGAPTSRRWAYAVSKLYDEHMLMAMAEEHGLQHTILRFFGSYGPRNHPSWWGGPQSAFIERLLDDELIDIHGDGQQTRTFTFVARHRGRHLPRDGHARGARRDHQHRRNHAVHHPRARRVGPRRARHRTAAARQLHALHGAARQLRGRPAPRARREQGA